MPRPRRYPEPFGEAVARLHYKLATTNPVRLFPRPGPRSLDILRGDSVSKEADALFANARLGEVVHYLRNGKNLILPEHWSEYFNFVR